jgi:hypothetical protein
LGPLVPLRGPRPDAKLLLLPCRLVADDEVTVPAAEEKRLETEPEKAASEASDEEEPVRALDLSPGPPLRPPPRVSVAPAACQSTVTRTRCVRRDSHPLRAP